MKTSDLIDVPATLPSNCPTLILQGELDPWTTAAEIDRVDRDLRGTKQISSVLTTLATAIDKFLVKVRK